MAVSTRSVRQLGSSFQNRLDNLGSDQFGDSIAAARTFHLTAPTLQSGTVGELSTLTDGVINASNILTATAIGFSGGEQFLNAANLSAIGEATDLSAWSKLQMGLADIYVEAQLGLSGLSGAARDAALGSFVSSNSAAHIGNGYVAIDAVANNGDGAALLAQLEALGLERGASFGGFAGGLIAIDRLDELSGLSLLAFARPVYAETNAGSVMSQNVAAMNVDYLTAAHPTVTGAGITIGFLSDSFNTATLTTGGAALSIHYAQDITSGDLPAGVNILSDVAAASVRDEGRAMAQLAWDVAPGASLAFHTAFISMADFAQGILDLKAAGANIIVDDVRYFAEPFFQDGIVAQAVDAATAAGAMYFSSAGNQGTASYASSQWRGSGQLINVGGVLYELYDFDPGAGIDFVQAVTKSGTVTSILNWDQPNFSVSGGAGAQSDLVFFNVTAANSFGTLNTANIGGDAIEAFQNSGAFTGVAVGLRVGDVAPGFFQFVLSGSVTFNEFATNSGTSYGHSNAGSAISVAASDWIDSGRFAAPYVAGEPMPYLETFSSRGDIPILFDIAGNRLAAPIWRSNVDFTASDGGNNTFFGSDVANSGAYAGFEADTNPNFYGTSAAAPNAAAVAALLMQAFPTATRAQIETALKQSAIDVQVLWNGTQIGDGIDNRAGWGHIQADRAYDLLLDMLNGDPAQLGTGQAAIISYETDTSAGGSPDGLRFVLLDSLGTGGVIYITDRAWNGTAFTNAAGEGTYVYTAPSNLAAGTIITLTAAQLTAAGITLSNAGETIYMYQGGQDAPTRFLFAVDIADGNTTFNGNLTNTGLTAGLNAVAVSFDNASYAGSATQIPATQLLDIATTTRWHGTDTDDNAGTPNYTEVQDTTVSNTFTNPDMLIIAGMAGGGQSDAILRIGNDEAANVGSHLARLFRDNPAFNHISDISFDLENGFFFFVDSDFNNINRIMRGNIADLVSGISNPTFTQLFATDNQNNGAGPVLIGEGIDSLEINTATNKLYWVDGSLTGDFEGGWQVYSMNYDGTGVTLIATIDTENDTTDPASLFGVTGVADYAVRTSTNIMYIAASNATIDGLGNATVLQNHIMSVNLTTGAIATLLLDNADPRSINGNPNYDDGRLNPLEGQIIGIDVDQTTGIIYFVTQPISANDHGGIFSYDPATDDLVELWDQPTNNAFNTLQTFPTSNMTFIEVDEVGHRLYISTLSDTDSEFDGNPATNEDDASIFTLAIGAAPGTNPTLFQRVVEVTANGAPVGMEIDYAPVTAVTGAGSTYTESTNGPGSPAGATVAVITSSTVTDPDNTMIQGATVAITTGFFAGDTLSFTNSGGITGNYNAANGVVTFTGLATLAQYQTVLNSVRFTNAGDNPTNYGFNTSRTISFTTFDGLANSDPATATVTVVGINDAPVNTVSSPQAASEDTGKVITGLSVADPDADPATQNITVTLSVTHGTITVFGNAGGGVTAGQIANNGTATVTITATQNQINATFAHASGVTYLNTLDFNGVDTLTITTNDNGLNGNDPGLTGTGTSEQDQDNVTINIAAVNDAPVVSGDGTEDSVTIFEDQPSAVGQTISSLFSGQYSDQKDNQIPNGGASSAGAFSGIAVVGNNSTAGTGNWQYFNGSIWVDIGTVSLSAAKLFNVGTSIRFNPAADYNGAEPTLIVRLIDNSLGFGITDAQVVNISGPGATGGTTAYSTGTVTLGGTITPVNDAPTSTGLGGDIAVWTEGGSAVLLDVGSNLTVADIDSANFDTGTLTVHIGTGLVAAQDQLVITATGGVTFDATTVSVGGIQIATYTGGGAGGGDLVFTLDPDATPAAVQALMRAIAFNNSGGDNPTAGSRAITWTLVDGDGTANGGADTLIVNSSVNVIAVNDAPSGTDHTATFLEDATYTFALADFGYSDVDGNNLFGVRFTTIPGVGTVFVDTDGPGGAAPIAVTAGTIVAASEIAAGHVYYVPAPNGNGIGYASFTFQVRDDGGTTNGGVDLDQTPNNFTFDVTSVNDAPTSTNLSGDAATWIEGSAAVLLDVGSNMTLADVDSMNFDSGTLTVGLTGGNVAQDGLFITAVGGVTFDATTVSVGGIQIATYTGGGYGGGNIVFTFDPDATPAAVQALMRALAFNNNGGISPTAGLRTVTWTLVDGDGTANGGVDTLGVNSTVDVQAINDAPAGTDNTITINEDASYTLVAGDFGFSDVNMDAFAGVLITTIPVPGTLFYDADGPGGAAPVAVSMGQFITAADIAAGKLTFQAAANANGVPYTSFTFQVRDTGGTGNGGQDTDQSANSFTFNITALNDAPTTTVPGTQVINEDTTLTFSTGNGNAITVADVDATVLTVTLSMVRGQLTLSTISGLSFSNGDGTDDTTMTFTGTATDINAALNGLLFEPTINDDQDDTLTIQVTDNGQTGAGPVGMDSDTVTIDVVPVNDAPSGADNTVTGSEDDPYVFTVADFGFSDPNDSPGHTLLNVRITTLPAVGTLFFDSDGPGGAAPVAVVAGQFISASDIAAGHLYFQPVMDQYGVGYASFTFQVQDNGGTSNGGVDLDQSANTITIDVTPDNLPPVVDLNSGTAGINNTTSFTEDGAAVAIGTSVTVAEQDLIPTGGSLVSMTVTLTDKVVGDVLTVDPLTLPPGISVSTTSNASIFEFEFTGTGTAAEYQAILASIKYSTTSQNPDVFGTDTSRTITVVVNDGGLDSATATATVNIVAIDDLPAAQPDAFTITESQTIVSGNLFADNGSGADDDPDGPPLAISAVNGSAANVNNQITLGSGALLTVHSNGTFDYDPNGVFLPTPTAGSGASNTPSHDGFNYTLAGGNTVSVSITLTGLDTDDFLLGTAGTDILMGGNGNDTYVVGNASDQVIEGAGMGNDVVYALVSYQLTAGQEIERLSAVDWSQTTPLNLTGNGIANLIEGNAGANILNGAGGADVMIGFGGDDIYVVDNAGDQALEVAGQGNDVVYALVDYTLGEGTSVERLSSIDWTQTSALNLTGSSVANLIEGNAGVNILNGAAGADTLVGFGGNDTYVVDNAGDAVVESAGQGSDIVYALVDYTLTAGSSVERLSSIDWTQTGALNLTGNELANLIEGNAGANILDGKGGADSMVGFAGNDTFYVDNAGDNTYEAVGDGNDAVYSSVSYTLTAGQEIELLAASDFSSTVALNLTGNNLDNTIYGNDGNNVLDGKGGNDLLVGLAGVDTFAFTSALGASNVDVVFGFTTGSDKIALDDAIFTAIGPLGALNPNAFVVGAAAADASDRIIYNSLTGQLFYDADGTGAGAAIQFATMSPGLALTASDFTVI